MIKGVTKKPVPYVLEDDRDSAIHEQTVFHITPKTGSDNNITLQRYASASKENRKGFREINVSKLNSADREEFLAVVSKVENYVFPEGHHLHQEGKVWLEITGDVELSEIAATLAADHLAEVLEVANNINKLTLGAKKNSNS